MDPSLCSGASCWNSNLGLSWNGWNRSPCCSSFDRSAKLLQGPRKSPNGGSMAPRPVSPKDRWACTLDETRTWSYFDAWPPSKVRVPEMRTFTVRPRGAAFHAKLSFAASSGEAAHWWGGAEWVPRSDFRPKVPWLHPHQALIEADRRRLRQDPSRYRVLCTSVVGAYACVGYDTESRIAGRPVTCSTSEMRLRRASR